MVKHSNNSYTLTTSHKGWSKGFQWNMPLNPDPALVFYSLSILNFEHVNADWGRFRELFPEKV